MKVSQETVSGETHSKKQTVAITTATAPTTTHSEMMTVGRKGWYQITG